MPELAVSPPQPTGDAFNAGWYPDQAGYKTWDHDPRMIASSLAPAAGFPFFFACPIPATLTAANVVYAVSTAGSGVQLPVNVFFGVYDSSGQRRGLTAAQDTPVQSAGVKTAALVLDGGQSLTLAGSPGAFLWVGFIIGTQSTTAVQMACVTNGTNTPAAINGTLPAQSLLVGRLAGGQTTLPTSFTPSTLVASSNVPFWVALT